jgi:farnesyl-diphosphate farnesyltransferase
MNHYAIEQAYQSEILQGVSRTFALTIPQLPPPLRTIVENGYLLCRIADTIEDEPTLTPSQKAEFSQLFIHVVEGKDSSEKFSKQLFPLLSEVVLHSEKNLIANAPTVLRLTHSFSPSQQAALSRCVRIMAEGMTIFQQNNTVHGLKNLAEMNRYCYYVAGVVGEMLTQLFCEYSPDIAKNQVKLEKLATSFGQGLQMTNILKDIWSDLRRGACWLPQDIFKENGFDLKDLSPEHHDSAFNEGLMDLLGIAHFHLYQALHYILLIPSHEQGIRRFCLWALGMAVLTLRRIHQRLDFSDSQQVKISRLSVKATVMVTNIAAHSDVSLRFLFYLFTRKLPEYNFSHVQIESIRNFDS